MKYYNILKYLAIIPAFIMSILYIVYRDNVLFIISTATIILYVLFISVSIYVENNIKKEKVKDFNKSKIQDL
jgi:membrane protein YdbS with pleckstrin-like domain